VQFLKISSWPGPLTADIHVILLFFSLPFCSLPRDIIFQLRGLEGPFAAVFFTMISDGYPSRNGRASYEIHNLFIGSTTLTEKMVKSKRLQARGSLIMLSAFNLARRDVIPG
jgi:hypothetical protein